MRQGLSALPSHVLTIADQGNWYLLDTAAECIHTHALLPSMDALSLNMMFLMHHHPLPL